MLTQAASGVCTYAQVTQVAPNPGWTLFASSSLVQTDQLSTCIPVLATSSLTARARASCFCLLVHCPLGVVYHSLYFPSAPFLVHRPNVSSDLAGSILYVYPNPDGPHDRRSNEVSALLRRFPALPGWGWHSALLILHFPDLVRTPDLHGTLDHALCIHFLPASLRLVWARFANYRPLPLGRPTRCMQWTHMVDRGAGLDYARLQGLYGVPVSVLINPPP